MPDGPALAELVSGVTEVLCGTTFFADDWFARGDSLNGRMFLLPLIGPRKINIVLACDLHAARTLACALFACDRGALVARMVDDAVRELLDLLGRRIAEALDVPPLMGLPRETTMAEVSGLGGLRMDDAVLLSSRGRVDLRLWICELRAAAEPRAATAERPRGIGVFRSLLRKVVPSG